MSIGGIDGDTIVALFGIVMALALVSRSSALRAIDRRRRIAYAAVWALALGIMAALFERLRP